MIIRAAYRNRQPAGNFNCESVIINVQQLVNKFQKWRNAIKQIVKTLVQIQTMYLARKKNELNKHMIKWEEETDRFGNPTNGIVRSLRWEALAAPFMRTLLYCYTG